MVLPTKSIVAICSVFFIFSLVSPMLRFFTTTTAGFYMMPRPGLFAVSIFIGLARFCTSYLAVNTIALASDMLKIPQGILMFTYLVFPMIGQILDFEGMNSVREMSMRESGTSFEIFQFRTKPLFMKEYAEEGLRDKRSDALLLMQRQIQSRLSYYVSYILSIVLFISAIVVIILLNYRQILNSLGLKLKCFAEYASEKNKDKFFKKTSVKIVLTVMSVVHLGLFVSFLALQPDSVNGLQIAAPNSWVFFKSLFPIQISAEREAEALEMYRKSVDLPEGRDWLDERKTPEFPLVHADQEVVAAYNPGYQYNAQQRQPAATKMPNIIIVAIESFSPLPFYMDNTLISSTNVVHTGKMFDDEFLPNINRLAENGVGFSGLSSESLPTFGGLFGLVSGSYEQDMGVSIVMNMYNDLDDLPSYFRAHNYHTSYVSTSPLEFDVKNEYSYRGGKQLRGPDHLERLPRWYDEIHWYYPNDEQAIRLGIPIEEKPPISRWNCDRLTASEVIYHSDQYLAKGTEKPLFEFWTTVETHGPFEGYDSLDEYEMVGNGLNGGYSFDERNNRYSTLIKYTDKHIGRVIDHFNNTNTIIVVVGDHGSRDTHSLRTNETIKERYTGENVCTKGTFGNDQAMATTAVISYLGNEVPIKNLFDDLKKKVYMLPTDHQDLAYTLQDIVAQLDGSRLVSSREGRNLLQLTRDGKIPEKHHISYRSTGYSIEYATEKELVRGHSLATNDAYKLETAIYPTCVIEKRGNYSSVSKDDYAKYKLIGALLEKVDEQNRMFNYDFRDFSCVDSKSCEFPTPNSTYFSLIVIVLYVICPLALLAVLILVSVGLHHLSNKLETKYDFTLTKCFFRCSPKNRADENSVEIAAGHIS